MEASKWRNGWPTLLKKTNSTLSVKYEYYLLVVRTETTLFEIMSDCRIVIYMQSSGLRQKV